METTVQRRLRMIGAHVQVREEEQQQQLQQLQRKEAAAVCYIEEGYSVVLPEKLSTGVWNVYRNAKSPLKLVEGWDEMPELRTLHDNYVHAMKTYADRKYLGARVRNSDGSAGDYKWMTFGEAGASAAAIGSALIRHGIGKGSSIGLYMINRPEWLIAEQACCSFSYTCVPLYDTLGADAVQYIINHAEIAAVFCTQDKLQTILSCVSDLPTLKLIGVVESDSQPFPYQFLKQSGVEIIPFSKLEAEGVSNSCPYVPPKAEDVATICYTSGTTGTPKGVVLTHANLIASCAGNLKDEEFTPNDVYISYLPLAHIYERMNSLGCIHYGIAIGFYQGDVLKLMDDIVALKPTIFASVPRLYNRIYDKILSTVRSSGGLKERIFNMAFNAKKEALAKGKNASGIWDRLVFNKMKGILGGRVRFLLSGASPISPEVLDFMRICFCAEVREGYGMTETACVVSVTNKGDTTSGHVGAPSQACEVKLADVPEMEYTSADKPFPRGEVCVRGPINFGGYYKDNVQTREVLDEEGWLHTGDVGMWLPGGRLKIIDRKKNIFKLAQGEYIAPEKIENVYTRSSFISQCFLHGDSLNSSLVAIVVLDPDTVPDWAKAKGIAHWDDLDKLCKDPVVQQAVLADMDEMARQAQLRGFEWAKAVTPVAEPFSLENGLLTPTLKVKRPQAKAYFAQAISDMYAGLARQPKSSL